jgi:hypothetical protein
MADLFKNLSAEQSVSIRLPSVTQPCKGETELWWEDRNYDPDTTRWWHYRRLGDPSECSLTGSLLLFPLGYMLDHIPKPPKFNPQTCARSRSSPIHSPPIIPIQPTHRSNHRPIRTYSNPIRTPTKSAFTFRQHSNPTQFTFQPDPAALCFKKGAPG